MINSATCNQLKKIGAKPKYYKVTNFVAQLDALAPSISTEVIGLFCSRKRNFLFLMDDYYSPFVDWLSKNKGDY